MHVAEVVRKYETKAGPAESRSYLLRRSFRKRQGTPRDAREPSCFPPSGGGATLVLAGKTLVVADEGFELLRARPHGHVAAVAAQAKALGFPEFWALPAKSATSPTPSAVVCGQAETKARHAVLVEGHDPLRGPRPRRRVPTDEAYGAMDWLYERQDAIERALARRHLSVSNNPSGRAYFDLSSSWMEGRTCPLASFGYSRDAKRGKPQIEYGLLTDPKGCPVAIRVFPGNTADPVAFVEIVDVVRENFGLTHLVMVDARALTTSARIEVSKASAAWAG